MTKPITPEQLVPGSLQGADPKPEDTVAGPNGSTSFTQDYLSRHQQEADKPAPFDPNSPEAVAAGAQGFGEKEAEELAEPDSDGDGDDDAEQDDSDEVEDE